MDDRDLKIIHVGFGDGLERSSLIA